MKRGYNPGELEHCRFLGCQDTATVIVHRKIGRQITEKDKIELLLSYCEFHAIAAESFFGSSQSRVEVKGIIRA